MDNDPNDLAAVRAAKNKARILLRNIPQVSGIGITQIDDRYAVKVSLDGEPATTPPIPPEIDGVPVVVHRTGTIRKLDPQG